jgi:hypothetical protein
MSLIDTVYGGGINKLTQERRKATADEVRKLLASRPDATAGERIGTSFGTSLGKSLGRGMFGDPEKDQAQAFDTDMQQVYSTFQKGDPRGARAVVDVLNKHGKYKEANQMVAQMVAQAKMNAPGQPSSAYGKELIDAGYKEGSPEFAQAIREKHAASNKKGQGPNFRLKASNKSYDSAYDSGNKAEGQLPLITTILEMTENPSLDSGFLADYRNKAKEIVLDLGYSNEEYESTVGSAQTFAAVQTELLNKVLNEATGPQTDEDAKRALKSLAQSSDMAWAQRSKAQLTRQFAITKVEKRDWLSTFSRENKDLDSAQVMEAWRKHDKGRTTRTKMDMAFRHPPKEGSKVGSPIFFGEYLDGAMARNPELFESIDGKPPRATRELMEKEFQKDIDGAKRAKKKTK